MPRSFPHTVLAITSNKYCVYRSSPVSYNSKRATNLWLFGSKLGFVRVLDSLSSALWRCLMFEYNFSESEPSWMKSGALWAHCLGLAATDFGRKLDSQAIFCQVNNARLYRSASRWILLEQKFENFPVRGRFSKKRKKIGNFLLRLQAAITPPMIIDRRKFITEWSLYGMSSFDFYHWNQFRVIPLACTLRPYRKCKNMRI